MPKAEITTRNGTKVSIEGTSKEVAALIAQFDSTASQPKQSKKSTRDTRTFPRPTPIGLVADLIDGGFFKKPKELAAIKTALEEQGHFYPITTLSPTLLRLVRKRELRRIKDKKRWLYVG